MQAGALEAEAQDARRTLAARDAELQQSMARARDAEQRAEVATRDVHHAQNQLADLQGALAQEKAGQDELRRSHKEASAQLQDKAWKVRHIALVHWHICPCSCLIIQPSARKAHVTI